jgi:hypothetical protein
MRYQQDLQVALRERLRRLMTAHHDDFGHQLDLTTEWISKRPALMAILTSAERVEPDLNHDEWAKGLADRQLTWPARTEEGKVTLVWGLMKYLAKDEIASSDWRMMQFTFASQMSEVPREMTERLFAPLFDFLTEHVGEDSSILYILERYVRRVEWFERDALFADYSKDTRRGEEVYDRDLRKFLFSEGINMPFSQAKSASGLSDVLTELDSDDPLVCEVKLFDADNHGKREIAAGLNQVTHYADDYGKTSAYLVIINLSGRALDLPTDGEPNTWPRHIDLGNVRTYLIPVRALPPQASASKLGKATPVTFSRNGLINPDAS